MKDLEEVKVFPRRQNRKINTVMFKICYVNFFPPFLFMLQK